jgi:hypothetical protein
MIVTPSRYHTTWRRQSVGNHILGLFSSSESFLVHSFVLAATDHLRQKIIKLEARIHSLEDAIVIAHDSNEPHPLLASVGTEEEEEQSMLKPAVEESEPSTLIDALGTLHLDDQGAARFFGPYGGSEVLLFHPLPPSC